MNSKGYILTYEIDAERMIYNPKNLKGKIPKYLYDFEFNSFLEAYRVLAGTDKNQAYKFNTKEEAEIFRNSKFIDNGSIGNSEIIEAE